MIAPEDLPRVHEALRRNDVGPGIGHSGLRGAPCRAVPVLVLGLVRDGGLGHARDLEAAGAGAAAGVAREEVQVVVGGPGHDRVGAVQVLGLGEELGDEARGGQDLTVGDVGGDGDFGHGVVEGAAGGVEDVEDADDVCGADSVGPASGWEGYHVRCSRQRFVRGKQVYLRVDIQLGQIARLPPMAFSASVTAPSTGPISWPLLPLCLP